VRHLIGARDRHIEIGVGAWINLTKKFAKGRAIYVPPVN
jgi:hypothetical protein